MRLAWVQHVCKRVSAAPYLWKRTVTLPQTCSVWRVLSERSALIGCQILFRLPSTVHRTLADQDLAQTGPAQVLLLFCATKFFRVLCFHFAVFLMS